MLRLACYQAAGGARRVDPQLAEYYRHLMVERGHCHTQATVAVARKLVERTWTVLTRGQPFPIPRPRRHSPDPRSSQRRGPGPAVPKTVRARAPAHAATAPLQADQVVKGTPRPGHQGSGGPGISSCHQRPTPTAPTNR